MAYNSSNGVCFEAIKDIKAGEELMALFDSLKGTVVVESYWAKARDRESKKMTDGGAGSSSPLLLPPPLLFPFSFSFSFLILFSLL